MIYKKSFGYADFENKKLNNDSTEFQLASVSKTFTAVAVMQLYEKGRLKLDDTFAKYFPEFPYKEMTLRQILSHSSGLSDQDLAGVIENYFKKHNGKALSNSELISMLAEAKVKLKLEPGQKWWYSNTGFQLLAALVEKISCESFDKYLYKHIFKPSGMEHTYLRTAYINNFDTPNLAGNYDYEFRYSTARIKFDGDRSYYNEMFYGHSNVISTCSDLLKFDNALYTGKLLKNKTLNEAFTPARLKDGTKDFVWKNLGAMGNADDGLGWFIFEDTTAGKIVWHTGGMPGCATILLRNTGRHQMVVLLDNTSSEGLYRSALSGMNILNGKPILPSKRSLAKIYGKALMSRDADYAFSLLQQYRSDTVNYNFSENDMNNLGYDFLSAKCYSQALETFKINTLLYPESDNAFNSYAEALNLAGKKEEAVLMYKKSLVINPGNEDSIKALKQLLN
ncbi:MAG: beta-lactamase family protein [Ignavibacteria bacterium]|nr:beta-lactamase family protein [Ignavibacteria bacterium]MCU7501951.1 beta-lactamase family protein [Ignavibacteria bacterium]MCU7516919.1 beta-lactamase family protein [Ignavibacteria bacterium]